MSLVFSVFTMENNIINLANKSQHKEKNLNKDS